MGSGNGGSNGAGGAGGVHDVVVPEGMHPLLARHNAEAIAFAVQQHAPLTPPKVIVELINGTLRDLPRVAELGEQLLAAPRGATWVVGIKRVQRIVGAPQTDPGLGLHAYAHIGDCQSSDDIIRWATTQSILTSVTARALITLAGYQVVMQPPRAQSDEESDDGDEPKPASD